MSGRKPLTLEELRKMDGKSVYLPETNCWVLITKNQFVPLFTFPDGEQCNAIEWYETVGPAYPCEPPRLDRSAWEPCGACRSTRDLSYWLGMSVVFCPHCGRPLTDAAWEMLERRLAGRENQ